MYVFLTFDWLIYAVNVNIAVNIDVTLALHGSTPNRRVPLKQSKFRSPDNTDDNSQILLIEQLIGFLLTESEEEIVETMFLMWQRMKLVVEPSGAVPLGMTQIIKIVVSSPIF